MIMHQLDFRAGKMLADLNEMLFRRQKPVETIATAEERGAKQPFVNGSPWAFDTAWQDFYLEFNTSAAVPGSKRYLYITTGHEGLWDAINPQFSAEVNGRIEQAFDVNHLRMPLRDNSHYTIVLHGYYDVEHAYYASSENRRSKPVFYADIREVDENLEQLLYDLKVPYEAALLLPAGERERETTLEHLSRALDLLDLRQPHSEAFTESVQQARQYLQTKYYGPRKSLSPVATAQCVGHTHIDVAWLWDLYQSRHKAVRSFSTVLSLMDRYPEYRFMSSQPALYEFVKEDAPALYERIRERIAEGRWEPEGGMWVEPDCNLTGGESLARQFLYGQRFFQTEFGKRSRILWLPDVFGYSGALPQLMRLSGIDYFMTTKLSWNEYNILPYDTFRWKGIDGSDVLTHFSPSREYYEEGHGDGHEGLSHYTTYNALLQPSQIAGGWKRFQQKELDDRFLVTYGYGDGGGGPADWMLEEARRMKTPLPNTPVVELTSARDFFEQLDTRVSDDPRLPVWNGELYLEYHRGTLTAQGRNKRNNRRIEGALKSAELRCVQAAAYSAPYPKEQFDKVWKTVLTLQFHDILPGSSIRKVYEDSDQMYANAFHTLAEINAEAKRAMLCPAPDMLCAWNDLDFRRDDLITFPAGRDDVHSLIAEDETQTPVQRIENQYIAFVRGLNPMGTNNLRLSAKAVSAKTVHIDQKGFETPFFIGTFDSAMRITSLWDKRAAREVCRKNQPLNHIVCYENRPHNYDAWDMNIYYNRRSWDVDTVASAEVISEGAVCAVLRVTYTYSRSTIVQDICVYQDIPRIDFKTRVDWREQKYLLKAHFPVDVFHTDATFDIQYGNIRRATHRNTSWDAARFELCAHKWMDISEPDYGVALLNDCKYGHSADDDGMALTLLKSSTNPDPQADQCVHEFQYALFPHTGDWRTSKVVEQAYGLNLPVEVDLGASGSVAPLLNLDGDGVIIEAVKRAEDRPGIVVRLYECFGRRCKARLKPGFTYEKACFCNILEDEGAPIAPADGFLPLELKPYQIITLLFR